MAHHDIVVIGASAGGIQALTTIASGLPAALPAALFVVVHIPPYAVSRLPEILSRVGPLPAIEAIDSEPIEPGRIYIAPPDRHLLVRPGWIEITRGPRENHSRPAIDPLFRSAARAYDSRVVGIILSGALYDGSLGLMAIETRGGVTIVQDPNEAAVDHMPRSALRFVDADYVAPAAAIAPLIADLATTRTGKGGAPVSADEEPLREVIADDFVEQARDERTEEISIYTCPDCGGVMWQDGAARKLWFRCHVGHQYAPEVLWSQKSEEYEAALWTSLRLLKEKATLTRQLATRTRASGTGRSLDVAERMDEQARLEEQHAHAIQELLEAMPSPAGLAEELPEDVERSGVSP